MEKYKRETQLLNEIKSRGVLTTKEYYAIAKDLDIVNITARRDLQNFIKYGYIQVNFGAINFISSNQIEKTRLEKKTENMELKKELGKEAVKFLEPKDVIFVTPGTTNEAFVQAINVEVKQLMTTGLEIFNLAKNNSHIGLVTLIGGNYRNQSTAFVGRDALSVLEKHKFSKGFFTGTDIDEELNVYNNNEEETDIFLKAMKNSKVKIALFDGNKFNGTGISYVTALSDFDYLISNQCLTPEKETEIQKIINLRLV